MAEPVKAKEKSLEDLFPIHWAVWHNDIGHLSRLLETNQGDVEAVDPHGRSPLHLAVTLGHLESVRILLRHHGQVNVENKGGWNVLQEAISTGDPEIVQIVLQHRDHQRATSRISGIPRLLENLRQAPDFYVEMKWEFTSWVPLMSRICPHDTYRVWKSGPNVRIDTTLIGFDNMTWLRGSRSFIFKSEDDHKFQFMEIDHDKRVVYAELLELQPHHDLTRMSPTEEAIATRLTSPITNTFIDTEKIEFTRSKAGIWGWRHDKVEAINGYDCKVFAASNVQLMTKTRSEHLTREDKEKNKQSTSVFASPLQSLLGVAEQHQEEISGQGAEESSLANPVNPTDIRPEEYFNADFDLSTRDIGRPKELSTKVQKFRATLWLSEHHPLSLQEQVLPIIDLMAISNAHFAKLRDFITLQLPTGFPVKIEIPLFHILNACITFGNLYAHREPVTGVSNVVVQDLANPEGSKDIPGGEDTEGDEAEAPMTVCSVDPSVFDVPQGYGLYQSGEVRYGEDEMLQLAIQQSLMESGSEDQMAILDSVGREASRRSVEDQLLERAIQESLLCSRPDGDAPPEVIPSGPDSAHLTFEPVTVTANSVHPRPLPTQPAEGTDQLELALQLSQQEMMEAERLRKQEEEELAMILQLSLTDK
ncbi:ankyrin repeat domain-containing protein 13D-like isoform X2 [Acanthaster planci]|uniref:Ankyrin repeat domain-containing protein 13D-like isoform X2 n=1 Tax=Acanthaster planci TaxID=133434 RepID=A0A8B7ZVM2_ACAPL|nr:ankyrin repeat domain-containing protein 13D-like isoform X2 [Acanthaster planci]